jgi:hypothetical protein
MLLAALGSLVGSLRSQLLQVEERLSRSSSVDELQDKQEGVQDHAQVQRQADESDTALNTQLNDDSLRYAQGKYNGLGLWASPSQPSQPTTTSDPSLANQDTYSAIELSSSTTSHHTRQQAARWPLNTDIVRANNQDTLPHMGLRSMGIPSKEDTRTMLFGALLSLFVMILLIKAFRCGNRSARQRTLQHKGERAL